MYNTSQPNIYNKNKKTVNLDSKSDISSQDIKEFSKLVLNEQKFYQSMGMRLISDMLV